MQPRNMDYLEDGPSANHSAAASQNAISRPFTLQESLPYSPQTSTVPFVPEIIPDPNIGFGSPAPSISDIFPHSDFDRLNREALGQAHLPRNTKQAVDLVLHEIKPSQRTHYNFKSVLTGQATSRPGSLSQGLSPITRAVYEKVGGYFKATKPNVVNPHAVSVNGNKSRTVSKDMAIQPGSIENHAARIDNYEAPKPQSRIEVVIPSRRGGFDPSAYVDASQPQVELETPVLQAPSALPASPDGNLTAVSASSDVNFNYNPASFRVELPLSHIKRDEYLEVAHIPSAPENLSSRKKERYMALGDQGLVSSGGLDQQQRAEAALESLDSLMRNVFSAVGRALGMDSGYDHVVTLTPENEVVLNGATQQKMQGAIQKAIALKCFGRVPVEGLLQIMKLSDGSLKQVDGMDIRADESWDEAAFDSWVQQLAEVEVGMKAARTCLRILSGGREDKRLYSESIINRCVNIFKTVTEDIIIPLVELRNSTSANLFRMVLKHKKAVSSTFLNCQKLFATLAELVTKVELSESVFNTLEFTASKLIFVENAYFEKDSAVGVQRFDGIRSVAMDMLCQIFLIKPEQRQGIIDDILTSLEKLPVGKQSARHFKLSEGGSIQPVSALLMRLVQASSGRVEENEGGRTAVLKALGNGNNEMDEDNEKQGAQQHAVAIQELEAAAAPLSEGAGRNASYIINFIVKRAIGSTKSGDTPYRNLLDLFVEDFTTCLDSPDWPSAELLLRLLMLMMVQLFEAPKTPAPAKNMALELLGTMSAAISRLRSHVKKTANTFETTDVDDLSRYLAALACHVLEQKSSIEQIVAWDGPYRASLEFLQARLSDDPYLFSAVSFLITDWATRVHAGYDAIQDSEDERDWELGRLAYRLRMMIQDRRWLSNEYTFKAVSPAQAKLSYSIILLRSPLFESFGKILNILLGSMAGDQATVRSKSLKSINQVLETDPSILDGDSTVIQLILDCSSDSSTQVRDSALGLLGSCITLRPALESPLTPKIIDRFQDAGVGVRKRAMKLARDIYLRNHDSALRSSIANGLLRRVQDPDEGVRDLARQMIEEVWFAPFYGRDNSAAFQTSLTEHVALIIQTVKSGNVTEILDKVFQSILRPKDKSLEGPFAVCSHLVSSMFGLIDSGDSEEGGPTGRDALQVLTIFAKADPKLFSLEQIRLLKPHLASFSGTDELAAFRAVTVIYKRVLPQLPTVHSEFLTEIRLQLLKGIGKISSRGALDDLIACTKVVCDLLKDFGPLGNLVASGLLGIQKLGAGGAALDSKRINHLAAYSIIVGSVGKHCDLDQQMQIFKARFPKWQGDSVPRLIVDVLSPFSSPSQPLEARKASLEAIGLVCQSWPRNYVLAKVYTAFQQVFQEEVPILETMILKSFKEFLLTEERRSEAAAESGATEKKRELTVMGGTNFDDVASATTQRFLKDITRISLGSLDELAFLAMEVLGSINRQGLTHPKETGVTLMTLETSSNRKIAELAFMEHRSLHEKHETVLEREYVKAIQSAYNYQRDIVKDSHGAIPELFQPKLHLMMEVLKISKMKNRQRFLEKLCGLVNFDIAQLDASEEMPPHLDFSRFVIENMAFFEYQTVGELQTIVNMMEKIVSTTGAAVAHLIESEVFDLMGETVEAQATAEGESLVGLKVDPNRLRQLTTGAIILSCLWEARTHLRRLYGMGTSRHDGKAKALAKDLNKMPMKVQGVHGERFWDEVTAHVSSLETISKMAQKCKAFVELMNVDKELKVQDDDDEEMALEGPSTPSEGEEESTTPERGRKRKGVGTPGGRKKRARSGSQPRKRGRPRKGAESRDEDEDMEWI
ncbi:HEAT repeat associated with sister chromatid cohesion domain-containing protein [Trichoderma breve]|uniref:Sister chromatid cohesion protein n=1 Tax=Trichoderma breve TaxID=2034170 RepID=A0A9W9EDT2_9HYPO|nr:HEAT repeat associated with sister chromatid cohesion domain-containing protein [Trichoderma breve]KAJ4864845.1 HEAT repeat associated with sister chromatid cohesion domain-containing protein [Trichoderma breve]